MAAAVGRNAAPARGLAPDDSLPEEYWQALLTTAGADERPIGSAAQERLLRLRQVRDHVLRVECRRCGRTLEIQKADAVRLYGPETTWQDLSQRLLNDTCTQRTGRYEEDGCWPSFD
ncbi:hypothetical protein SSBR45G_46490 [Bradyrhizobium sp. SSBR45G]|nr:hypothetical protein SSBR45G_46490 [Bradyrhizobium sp. SSBR45G]GLH87142.1 hypothetical protein SSBR45R_46020 [Bradyrhizobium sp. SSBR45R]